MKGKRFCFSLLLFFAFSCIACLDSMLKMFNNVHAFTQYLYANRVASTQHINPKKKQ